MNAMTYDLRNAAATAKVAAPKEGFWTRLLNAMIEADRVAESLDVTP